MIPSNTLLNLPKRPPSDTVLQINKISSRAQLVSNLFPINLDSYSLNKSQSQINSGVITCYQYDVEFDPEVADDNRQLRYSIFKQGRQQLEAEIGHFYFSGKSLFTLRNLSEHSQNQAIIESILVQGTRYSMRIRLTKQFTVDEDEAKSEGQIVEKKGNKVTQVLNVVLKQCIRDMEYHEIGKNSKFFDPKSPSLIEIKDKNGNITSTLEAYKGFNFGIHPSATKLFLMVDHASRILRQETALEFLRAHQSNPQKIIGQSVITKYNNFTLYKIERVATNMSPRTTLEIDEKTQMSCVQYYMQRYRLNIRDMNQPLLIAHKKIKDPLTKKTTQKEIFLVPEICTMTGMNDTERTNFQAMKEVSKHTKLAPKERFIKSQNFANILAERTRSDGLRIDISNSTVNSLVLNPPTIIFGNGSLVPKKGNFEQRSLILDESRQFNDWSIIYERNNNREANSLVEMIQKCSQEFGIAIDNPIRLEVNNFQPQQWINKLDEDFTNNGLPLFVLSFAPNRPQTQDLYKKLKKFLQCEVGIEHQHVNTNSLQKNAMSICSKIVLQIAAKLGRKLWRVKNPDNLPQNCMLIGIETSMKKIQISNQFKQVIGVVASLNSDFTKYFSKVELRTNSDTILTTLSTIITAAIEAYAGNNKNLPSTVIIYRQGLGEGQINTSLDYEIQAFKNGCTQVNVEYRPKMIFFQVNKKIGQKFYQKAGSDMLNPTFGSLIADGVVGRNFEFYLCAQNCNSGVCTPTKYLCLHNSTDLSESCLWQLTYFQCFNYYNWSGPVRVPAPMMYAGKLAKFTSEVLESRANDSLTNSLYYL